MAGHMVKTKKEQHDQDSHNSDMSLSRIRALEVGKVIGENLKSKRVRLGLTQSQLGDFVNVTYQQIQKYESGSNVISAALLYDISLHLNTPVSNFYQGLEVREENKALTPDNQTDSLTKFEILEVIRAFSTIHSKKLRQSLIKTINYINNEEKDD